MTLFEVLRQAVGALNQAVKQMGRAAGQLEQVQKVLPVALSMGVAVPVGSYMLLQQRRTEIIGRQGVEGEVGPGGQHGDQGGRGRAGGPGGLGDVGDSGQVGVSGADGSSGIRGRAGGKGASGSVGDRGLSGQGGPLGPDGPEGGAGGKGISGARGNKGSGGKQGQSGQAGPEGQAGVSPDIPQLDVGDISALSFLDDIIRTVTTLDTLIDSVESKISSTLEPGLVDLRLSVTQCEPVPIMSAPFTISSPGIYCLARDVQDTITIASDDVEFDLNGRTIRVVNDSSSAIAIEDGLSNVRITNGFIALESVNSTVGIITRSGDQLFDLTISGIGAVVLQDEGLIQGLPISIMRIANVRNLTVEHCDLSARTGLFVENCFNIVMRDSRVQREDFQGGATSNTPAVRIQDSENISIERCVTDQNSDGFLLSGEIRGSVSFADCVVSNNIFVGYAVNTQENPVVIMERCSAINSGVGFFVDSTIGTRSTFIECVHVGGAPNVFSGGFFINRTNADLFHCEMRNADYGIMVNGVGTETLRFEHCKITDQASAGIFGTDVMLDAGVYVGNYCAGNGATPGGVADTNYDSRAPGALPFFQVTTAVGVDSWDNVSLP